MFRNRLYFSKYTILQNQLKTRIPYRLLTNDPPKEETPHPPKRGWFGKLFALTIVGSAGVVGYSWVDKDFKNLLEDSVPYSKEAFQYIFQFLPEYEDLKKTPLEQEKILNEVKPIIDTIKPKIQEESNKNVKEIAAKPVATPEKSAKELAKELANEKRVLEKKKAEEELKRREEEESKLNKDLEQTLTRLLMDCHLVVNQSISSFKTSADVVQAQVQKLKLAMESKENSESQWEEVVKVFETKSDILKQAIIKSDRAKAKLEELKSAVTDAKNNKITKKNKQLLVAEEEFSKLNYNFNSAAAELSKSQSDYKVYIEYRDLVKKGKEQFKKEIEAIMPSTTKTSGSKMTEDELNSLIAHAHRRIEQLQQQLAQQQAMEHMRMGDALDIQKKEDAMLAENVLQIEKERWNETLDLVKQKWGLEARIEFEEELRMQLTRQAAAHNDHLGEVLRVQKEELGLQFADLLKDRIEAEHRKFELNVATLIARLKGIETAIDRRADLEKESRRAQKLWVACSGLEASIKHGDADGKKMLPLDRHIAAIKRLAEGDVFVETIVASIPQKAAAIGVSTPSALVERFEKVARVCRRVALIDERGGTMAQYFLSYVQSWFVFTRPVFADEDTIENIEKLDVFQILDNAKASIARGNLMQATRYMNLLRGEARRIATDWLAEARLSLEVSQAVDALLAHTSASAVTTLTPSPTH